MSGQGGRRYCVIGAGYSGNGVAKALTDAGIAYDQVERNPYIGGNWADGVYDSTHIISSRDSTEYSDFPMPREYSDFPSREQVVTYLNSYVDHFGLREAIEFDTEVLRCEPLDENGLMGWRVELRLPDGTTEVRHYGGLIVANGHHWDKRYPDYPGKFAGREIHSKDYKRPADKHPTVNSQLLYFLRHGRVRPRRDIVRLDGSTVHFADGTSSDYDTIVWATGFNISFPFLDSGIFEWRDGVPVRVGSLFVPGLANLYIFGLQQPRGGAGPLITAGAEMVARLVQAQEHLDHPLGDDFARLRRPHARMLTGVSETMREIRRARVALRLIERVARLRGHTLSSPPEVPPAQAGAEPVDLQAAA